jgi:hypothetical protein
MVETCMEETLEVAAHLQEAHQDWLEQHPLRRNLMSCDTARRLRQRSCRLRTGRKRVRGQLEKDLAANDCFASRCNHFIKDLDSGELDYPPG